MARWRAVDKSQSVDVEGRLPLLYKSVVPITQEQHGTTHLRTARDFDFARHVNAIPLACDEFSQAMRDYPIVFTGSSHPTPLALVGLSNGVNDHVMADGSWTKGTYIPAYLRRYPFLLVNETDTSDRQILCADMSSVFLQPIEDEESSALFTPTGEMSDRLSDVLEFAKRYETAMKRTGDVMQVVKDLDLMQASTVTLSKGDQTAKIEGFSVIAEDRVRALDDAQLADLARRGLLGLFTAHQMSLANFSSMGALA
ncbi:MAG: SapC family protein [Pseudomonadota bacterium]